MPKLHDIPIWFTREYDLGLAKVINDINLHFGSLTEINQQYIDCLTERQRLGDHQWRDVLLSGAPLIYSGVGRNVGYMAIRIRNASVLRRILPSYMINSIIVHDEEVSMAEDSQMPFELAQRLTQIGNTPDDRKNFLLDFEGYSREQMITIRFVLELMSTRADEVGDASKRALDYFWCTVATD